MTNALSQQEDSILEWVWDVAKGDFNEDPTAGQVITNAIITAIPVIDQGADLRDLVANVKALIWDKRHNEFEVWLSLFFNLIGLIPSLGSLLKGVLKLIWMGSNLDSVLRLFNVFMKGNGVRWLKELRAGKLRQHSQQAAEQGKALIDNISSTIKQALELIPAWATNLHRNFNQLLNQLGIIRSKIDSMFNHITLGLEQRLDELLKQKKINSVEGNSRTTLMLRQEADPNVRLPNNLPRLPSSMEEVLYRMDDASVKVKSARETGTQLPQSPFTLDDKLRIVQAGLQEKYIVRVIKADDAKDLGSIGWVNPDSGRSTYWTTTYTQLEYADKDAELIAKAVGTKYDPDSDYTLLVIDVNAAAEKGDITTFIPTYERIGALAKSEMADVNPHSVDQVMTAEYSERYAEIYEKAQLKKIDLLDGQQLKAFANKVGLSQQETELLKVRQKINKKYGANEQFLGIGLAKNVNSPDGLGAVETFSLDKKPGQLGDLERAGVLKRINLTSY
jgi:hypothetical protein